jgi:AcrR family transcriptional regulator
VLQIAHELFYWRGIRATGVDRVAAEAGIAPTSLYRLFASKDDLVAAVAAGGSAPRDRILAVFDALAEQVRPEQCRGCPFLMALAEFPEREHPARVGAIKLKAWVRRRLGELAEEFTASAPGRDPDELADELTLLMEGVYASVQALGDHGPARRARAFAAALLDQARETAEPPRHQES